MKRTLQHSFAISVTIALSVFVLLLGQPQQAYAQCPLPAASGGVKPNHAMCQPAGPGPCTGSKGSGKDGCVCTVSGLPSGQSISAICVAGCCKRVSETSATDALGSGLSQGLAGGLGEIFKQLLQQLMGGGGGGGGGGGYGTPDFGTDTEEENLLDIDPIDTSFLDDIDTNSIVFGDNSNDSDTTGTQTNNDTGGGTTGETTGGNDSAPVQEGDAVVTTYEYTETVGENPIVGDGVESDTYTQAQDDDFFGDGSDFDQDFFGASLDTGDEGGGLGLTRAELEAQGLLEAGRLGGANGKTHSGSLQVPYESLTPAEIRTLQDYHSSAVAVSGQLSPLENSNNQEADSDKDSGTGFFGGLIRFLAALLGFGPPQN